MAFMICEMCIAEVYEEWWLFYWFVEWVYGYMPQIMDEDESSILLI